MPLTDGNAMNSGRLAGSDMVSPQPLRGVVGHGVPEIFGTPGAATRPFVEAANLGFASTPPVQTPDVHGLAVADSGKQGMDAILNWGAPYDLSSAGPDDGPKATPDVTRGSGL